MLKVEHLNRTWEERKKKTQNCSRTASQTQSCTIRVSKVKKFCALHLLSIIPKTLNLSPDINRCMRVELGNEPLP